MMKYASFFETGQGRGAVAATEKGICRVYLPDEDVEQLFALDGLDRLPPSALTEQVSVMLKQYFKGKRQSFDLVALDYTVSGDFRRRILESIRSIPFGEVKSYGKVAADAGSPNAARAVGGAMASNPLPIIIPCHRVVAGNGRLTGYTAPGGLLQKKLILQMEGVEFKGEIVDLKKDGY
ncbi:MAG: methylated-DNA--[protein]-cysteine S-methyltransferase [Desulfuromonadales bacterium]|nr:methylated-DNA--[protein]-cysteine S-methyltransferase [Desulfuromonadales bacterium]